MADPAGILDAIDHALEDYSVSADAMRSAPLRLPAITRTRMDVARRLVTTTGMDGYAALCVAAEAEHYPVSGPWREMVASVTATAAPDFAAVADGLQRAIVQVIIDVEPFMTALQEVGRKLAELWLPVFAPFGRAAAGLAHDLDAAERPRWNRRRCRTCNPAAFSDALPGGAEYHRRQMARKRRARRG